MDDLILSREAVRNVDSRAIQEFGLPGLVLMENAGRGAAECLVGLGAQSPVVICAGKGNNGGDGFVIARHLENHNIDVRVILFGDPTKLEGDAATNYQVLAAAGTPLIIMRDAVDGALLDRELRGCTWIVDALLGTGTRGEIHEPFRTVMERINAAMAKRFAVDLPSGLDCDTGKPLGCCVRADYTATFVAKKLGFCAPGAQEWTGPVQVIDIGIPRRLKIELLSSIQAK